MLIITIGCIPSANYCQVLSTPDSLLSLLILHSLMVSVPWQNFIS